MEQSQLGVWNDIYIQGYHEFETRQGKFIAFQSFESYSSKDPSVQAIGELFNPHETHIKGTAVVLNL